jgi:uncharacterized membrane protein YidH (DUF202 family)
MNNADSQARAFTGSALTDYISAEQLAAANQAAVDRRIALAHILHFEYNIPRQVLLQALEKYYTCRAVEYDERLPIPPELLRQVQESGIHPEDWFPVIKDMDGSVVVAAIDPEDPDLEKKVHEVLGPGSYEFRVTLPDDIVWFAQDFLHAPPGELIGTERTGLAYWRNIMAQWRTRMACYRTDLAKARTALSIGRGGLALTTIAEALWRSSKFKIDGMLSLGILILGILLIIIGAPIYLRVRRSRMTPPRDQTLVEVTAATLSFLEDFHFPTLASTTTKASKNTMLARLGDFLADYSTIIYPVPASRERTHLARERNVLAAQRTIAACYRTIYSRARTGLAFIRTGVYFISISIGLLSYFGLGTNTPFDLILMVVGLLLIIDGLLWYMPVRREQAELPSSRSAALEG